MPERRRTVPRTSERLGRMLAIVPYIVQHPGTTLGDTAHLFDVAADQLRRDLDLLFMSGLPPYGPGDLIDVDVDEDDRVYITMADHFARPLRLTRNEALALYLRGTELVATPGLPEATALASALSKLRDTLGPESLREADSRFETATAEGRSPEHLELLRQAARERRSLDIEYFAGSTGEWSRRRIDPEEVFSSFGRWYVVAWDGASDAERLFRADRIRDATLTSASFESRGLEGAGRALYTPTRADVPVRLRLKPAARWIAEYYATTDPVEHDGDLEVTLPARQLGWVARLLLRVAPDAQIVAPDELVEEVRDLAGRSLARYAS